MDKEVINTDLDKNINKETLNNNLNNTNNKFQINKKVLFINLGFVTFFLSITFIIIIGSVYVPTDDSIFSNFFKFIQNSFGKSINDIKVDKTNINNDSINDANNLINNSVKNSRNNETIYIGQNNTRSNTINQTKTTNQTTNKTKIVIPKKCTPKKTCNDYPGVCGINLTDGCYNNLSCNNCEKCLVKEILCKNKVDEDCDGYTDCADSDCKMDSACKLPNPENLLELSQRKVRIQKRINKWNFTHLEDPYTYIWQPELLVYKEQKTGVEVYKLTSSINYSNKYNDYKELNVWSPNGEFIYFMSFRPTNTFNNYNKIKKSFEPFLMKVDTNGNTLTSTSERPSIFRDAYSRYFDSPDKTKSAWQSDFMNFANVTDIFYSVNYYPSPPTDIIITYENGIKISWNPPIYESYAKEIKKYHIWRSIKADSNWMEIGETTAQYEVIESVLKPNFEALYYIDKDISNNDYFYAITSEEYSGLESDEFSEIIQVKIKNNNLESASKVMDRGFKNFWRVKPDAPSMFFYANTSIIGVYMLNWTEPENNKIKYYNIYYSVKQNVTIDQQNKIASVPYGNSRYIDFFADPNKTAYYGITSVDRYGNEGSIIYKKDKNAVTPTITETKKKNLFEDIISGIIKFFS